MQFCEAEFTIYLFEKRQYVYCTFHKQISCFFSFYINGLTKKKFRCFRCLGRNIPSSSTNPSPPHDEALKLNIAVWKLSVWKRLKYTKNVHSSVTLISVSKLIKCPVLNKYLLRFDSGTLSIFLLAGSIQFTHIRIFRLVAMKSYIALS